MNRKDITGQRFGRLVAIEVTERRDPRLSGFIWRCECDCGNEVFVRTDLLLRGNIRSCGCLQDENRRPNIAGQKRGKLTAIRDTGDRRNGESLWLWQCDCGNTCVFSPGEVAEKGGKVQCPECSFRLKAMQITEGRKHIERDENGTILAVKRDILAGKPPANNTSGVRGVSWHKGMQKWCARIHKDGRMETIGYYSTIEEAAAARMKAVEEKYGSSIIGGMMNETQLH